MPWFKIDDEWHDHPKVRKAGNAAAGLWARCGSHCSQYLTDGFIEDEIARRYGTKREIAALVEAKLWLVVEGGYQMPDFLDYNPSAEAVKRERAAAAERQRKKRGHGVTSPVTNAVTHTGSHAHPDPTRPDPPDYISDNDDSEIPEAVSSVSIEELARLVAVNLSETATIKTTRTAWVLGTTRKQLAERRSEYERVHAEPLTLDQAIDRLLGRETTPNPYSGREAWYANPDCQLCEGTGLAADTEGRFGACECRSPSPYEPLASVHPLRKDTA